MKKLRYIYYKIILLFKIVISKNHVLFHIFSVIILLIMLNIAEYIYIMFVTHMNIYILFVTNCFSILLRKYLLYYRVAVLSKYVFENDASG